MNTYKHIQILRDIFTHVGISKDRVQQYFCAAAEVERFINSVDDIIKKVEALPPLPKKNTNPN